MRAPRGGRGGRVQGARGEPGQVEPEHQPAPVAGGHDGRAPVPLVVPGDEGRADGQACAGQARVSRNPPAAVDWSCRAGAEPDEDLAGAGRGPG